MAREIEVFEKTQSLALGDKVTRYSEATIGKGPQDGEVINIVYDQYKIHRVNKSSLWDRSRREFIIKDKEINDGISDLENQLAEAKHAALEWLYEIINAGFLKRLKYLFTGKFGDVDSRVVRESLQNG